MQDVWPRLQVSVQLSEHDTPPSTDAQEVGAVHVEVALT
jgi:hypothetical protein